MKCDIPFLYKLRIWWLSKFSSDKKYRRTLRSILRCDWQTNQLIVVKNNREYKNCFLDLPPKIIFNVKGQNNVIKIHLPLLIRNKLDIFVYAADTFLEINQDVEIGNLAIALVEGQKHVLRIGQKTTFGGVEIVQHGNTECYIGEDCMFSKDVIIRVVDGHTILDCHNNVINSPKHPLTIGRHCWIGVGSVLLKNVVLPDYTIIGSRSVVSKEFNEPHTIIAGVPAKIIKRNVNWDRRSIPEFLAGEDLNN